MRDGVEIDLADLPFASRNDRQWGGLGVGGSYSWGDDKYIVHGEIKLDSSLENFNDSYAVTGNVGIKMRW